MSRAWYVLWTDGAKELEVVERALKHEKTLQALAPVRMLPFRNAGEWELKESIVFPNYVFIECDMDADIFHYLKAINHVRGWLGIDNMWPTNVPDSEMERVLKLYAGDEPSQFLDNMKVDKHKRRVYGTVTICGKEQKVTLPYEEKKQEQKEID